MYSMLRLSCEKKEESLEDAVCPDAFADAAEEERLKGRGRPRRCALSEMRT